jgi:hypothetical protein
MGSEAELTTHGALGWPIADAEEQVTQILDLAVGDQRPILNAVVPYLLSLGEAGCSSPGVATVAALVSESWPQLLVDLEPADLARAIRLLELCGQETPKNAEKDLLKQTSEFPGLLALWQETAVRCALSPEDARVGLSAWNDVSKYAYEAGGVETPDHHLDWLGTHYAVSILTGSTEICQRHGVLGWR